MAVNTYEDLVALVQERQNDTLTIAVDLGREYSEEYEEAKNSYQEAKGVATLMGRFLEDDLAPLKERMDKLKPEPNYIYVRFKRVPLVKWGAVIKDKSIKDPWEQYEKVLPDCLVGIFASLDDTEPLTTDTKLVSTKSNNSVISGSNVNAFLSEFLQWQNSGGEVTIHPTK